MELFELRYFVEVAQRESVRQASKVLRISPASLSKAVTRLEFELGIKLFSRHGRNIRLTPQGQLLQTRARALLLLEESTRAEVAGAPGAIQAVIAGNELLLSHFGMIQMRELSRRFLGIRFELNPCGEDEALDQVARGDAHLALVTGEPPRGWASKTLGRAVSQTCVGEGHPLSTAARVGRVVPIAGVLEHAFVAPRRPIFGRLGARGGSPKDRLAMEEPSADGWRDDRYPRRIEWVSSSLAVMGELVRSGQALAYFPDYYVAQLGARALKISGCPYSCVQEAKLVAKDPSELGWLNQLY
jgi:DNA-binding transcriptional LysR family regulator